MKTAIRKMGNSHGVIIPKPLLAEVGAKANDQVNLGVENGRIVNCANPEEAARRLGRGEQVVGFSTRWRPRMARIRQ